MIGRVVCSKAGRDKEKFLVIVGENDKFFFLCDGKERPLERPKMKNKKHLALTKTTLDESSLKSNKAIKRALAIYRDTRDTKEEA